MDRTDLKQGMSCPTPVLAWAPPSGLRTGEEGVTRLLDADPVAKTLTVDQKSGTDWQFEFVYRLDNGTPTQIRRVSYDNEISHPDTTIVTIEELIDGRWTTRTETRPRTS